MNWIKFLVFVAAIVAVPAAKLRKALLKVPEVELLSDFVFGLQPAASDDVTKAMPSLRSA